MRSVFLPYFNEAWIFLDRVAKKKSSKHHISWKSVKWKPSCSIRTDRQTWRKLTVGFLRYFERSYIRCVVLSTVLTGYATELGTNTTCIWYIRVKPIQSRLTSWLKVGSQPYRTCFFVMQANLKLKIKRHSFTSHIYVAIRLNYPLISVVSKKDAMIILIWILGKRRMAALILNLVTRWSWVANFTPRPT
jgi:hypothetical protein